MKKFLLSAVVIISLLTIPFFASASMYKTGREVTLQNTETANSNLYVAGANVTLVGAMKQDVVATGGNVLVTGSIGKDGVFAGGNVDVMGPVGEDLRIVGGKINVGGKVGGDLMIAGGQVHVISGASVGGDLDIAGGQIVIDAPVKGLIKIGGGEVTINSPVSGNIVVMSGNLTIGANAVLTGDVTYYSNQDVKITEGAQVKGKITKTESPVRFDREGAAKGFAAALGFMIFLKFLMTLIAGLVIAFIWKKGANELVNSAGGDLGIHALRGLAVMILVPIISLLLFVTMIGIPLGALSLVTFVLAMMLSNIFAGMLLGSLIYKYLLKKHDHQITWHSILVGNISLYLICLIPVVGWVAAAILFLAVMGTLWSAFKVRTIANR